MPEEESEFLKQLALGPLGAATSMIEAKKWGDISYLTRRIRDGALLTPEEREYLADVLEGKNQAAQT